MGTLEAKVDKKAGITHVKLVGAIDERVDLEQLFTDLDGDIQLDMGDVARINSIGVMRWIPAVEALCAKGHVTVRRASYVIINQANSVANFFATAEILSCLVPYFCPTCGTNQMVEVDVAAVRAAGGAPPLRRCATDATQLEFDELDSYFAFAQT